jgi:hypothetical protein
MATQTEKAFCVLEFHSTKSVTTVQQGFWRKFHKNPPCVNSFETGITDFKISSAASAKTKVQARQVPLKKQ